MEVFKEGHLSAEKSLIALGFYVVHCPYCIDACTKDGLEKGIEKESDEAAFIIKNEALVHGEQMMNRH